MRDFHPRVVWHASNDVLYSPVIYLLLSAKLGCYIYGRLNFRTRVQEFCLQKVSKHISTKSMGDVLKMFSPVSHPAGRPFLASRVM